MNTDQPARESETRARLIEAASEIFIERGFKAAKIRDIVHRAGTNIAAINYHFGGKDGLYAAVLRNCATLAVENFSLATAEERAPEALLHDFIRVFLQRLLDNNAQSRMRKLIAREMIEPTAAFNVVLEQFIVPLHRTLNGIVRRLLGSDATDETVRRCTLSIFGQCLYYQHSRRAVRRLDPAFHYTEEDVERLVEYITAFSLGGLRALAENRLGAAVTGGAR
jgi:TetR/AcrR family transcriptional regulator, regulator of cefoperazone and chloramphenicol sensitivity